ncbi:response regulator [Microscilla marina]|uniref:Response regulator receiver domain protein, putative n=1 Tax=Microscilla marina ATCC 23134 TaxID=313606 RepID=A1ZNJ9_MICM2|nr:response regulator [Microscilla marina]EAY28110.1 response regulator receiver domain protein, putative [Microscilla marina ATCC 23134]
MTAKYQHILVVDDDKTFIYLNYKLISKITGCNKILLKMSGITALQYLEECDLSNDFPELISIDWNMPLGNGNDFIQEYTKRFHPKHPQTKVLVISGATSEKQMSKVLQLDFVIGFLPKPVNEKTLANAIL